VADAAGLNAAMAGARNGWLVHLVDGERLAGPMRPRDRRPGSTW
jgi:hypothetical protein